MGQSRMLSAGQVGLIKGNTGWQSREAATQVKGSVFWDEAHRRGETALLRLCTVKVCVLQDAWACLFSHFFTDKA